MCLLHALSIFAFLIAQSKAQWVEGFWESWNMHNLNDFASDLSKIPANQQGTGTSVNIIDVAFSDFSFTRDSNGRLLFGYLNGLNGPDGLKFNANKLKQAVAAAKANGAKVKISFGGATFQMYTRIKSEAEAVAFAALIAEAVNFYKFDGVDFDIEEKVTLASIQIALIKALRSNLGSSKTISYTMPATAQNYEPYLSTIIGIKGYVDYFNIMAFDVYWRGYDAPTDFLSLKSKTGVPLSKIVWGIMPGCSDDPNENTTLEEAKSYAQWAKNNGLKGMMIWSLNRDTNHRTGATACVYQTGQPDGTYINAIAAVFSSTSPAPPPPSPTPIPPTPTPTPTPKPTPPPQPKSGPFMEAYWEAWNMQRLSDYSSDLSQIPVSAVGSGSKINIISIAFCDYSFSRDSSNNLLFGYVNSLASPTGQPFGFSALKSAVNAIHSKGGKVKISFGGATFSMSQQVTSQSSAETFVANTAAAVKAYTLDGVDFDIEDGSTSSSLIIYTLRRLREVLGSGYIISLTVPAMAYNYEPYRSVLQQSVQYLDYVTIMAFDVYWSGYSPTNDFSTMTAQVGVPTNKISWGVMPGCHDAPNEFTSVDDAKTFARYVKSNGMAGMMIWSTNRDTNHRTGMTSCLYQTGQPDSTYANAMAGALI